MLIEELRKEREFYEKLGKAAPRRADRPLNSSLANNGETCKTCVHKVTGDVGNTTVS